MKSKWHNKAQWLLIVGVSLAVIKQIASLAGYPIPDPSLESATNIATTIINGLAILGILSDPPQSPQKDENNNQSQIDNADFSENLTLVVQKPQGADKAA